MFDKIYESPELLIFIAFDLIFIAIVLKILISNIVIRRTYTFEVIDGISTSGKQYDDLSVEEIITMVNKTKNKIIDMSGDQYSIGEHSRTRVWFFNTTGVVFLSYISKELIDDVDDTKCDIQITKYI